MDKCPFGYFKSEGKCEAVASLDVPFPFTMAAITLTVFMAISHYMKNGNGDKYGTAFFVSCLAFTDILLRLNWFVLGILLIQKQFWLSTSWCAAILLIQAILNLVVWRRFFKFKYNMDDNDMNFVQYCRRYPRTSRTIIFISYYVTFQAIRISYSRLLGKKRFMASFTRRRKYYRLIGRLSVLEILFVFIPAITLNIYDLVYFSPSEQIFYITIDSLNLVIYSTILIAITLCQREKVLDPNFLFNWKELFSWDVETDSETMYEFDPDDPKSLRLKPGKEGATQQYNSVIQYKSTTVDLLKD